MSISLSKGALPIGLPATCLVAAAADRNCRRIDAPPTRPASLVGARELGIWFGWERGIRTPRSCTPRVRVLVSVLCVSVLSRYYRSRGDQSMVAPTSAFEWRGGLSCDELARAGWRRVFQPSRGGACQRLILLRDVSPLISPIIPNLATDGKALPRSHLLLSRIV